MCVSTNRPCAGTIQWESFVGSYIVFTIWFTCTLLYCHNSVCVLCSSVSSFFCQNNKATMPMHILTLVDSKRIATDSFFQSVYDLRWHYCQLFLSSYTETAWSFLVWQTWDIYLRDLAQEQLFFSTCQKFPLLFHFSSSHQLGNMSFFSQYWDS